MSFSYVLITCDTGHEDSIITNLKNIGGIKDVWSIFGTYDLLAQITENNKDSIISISNKIRNTHHVRATLTLFGNDESNPIRKLNSNEYDVIKQHMAQAFVMINCQKGKERSVLELLARFPEIIEGNPVSGIYDVVIRLVAPSYTEISEIVTRQIRKIKDIKSTNTFNLVT